jgi:hypothetical protein
LPTLSTLPTFQTLPTLSKSRDALRNVGNVGKRGMLAR